MRASFREPPRPARRPRVRARGAARHVEHDVPGAGRRGRGTQRRCLVRWMACPGTLATREVGAGVPGLQRRRPLPGVPRAPRRPPAAALGTGQSAQRARSVSQATAEVEAARAALLRFLGASPDEFVVVFTANASAACRLVGESFPFARAQRARAVGRQPQLGEWNPGVRRERGAPADHGGARR